MISSEKPQQAVDPLNLFVKYLPYDIDDVALEALFKSFGPILSAKVMVCDLSTVNSLSFFKLSFCYLG